MVDTILMTDPPRSTHPLRGLLISQALGAFNDNAWKQIVILLAIAAAASAAVDAGTAPAEIEAAAQERAALAQVILMIPLTLFYLPGGVLADRISKHKVILGLKLGELILMVIGTVALVREPSGGVGTYAILGLLGVQAALFGPSKYGILPEILPHERLSSGNGLMEMATNLSIIAGIVAGGVIVSQTGARPWLGGLLLTALSLVGLIAAFGVPHVPVARSEGGLATSLSIAWSTIRTDRIIRLAIVGQIVVWSIASLVPAPIMAYSKMSLRLEDWKTGFPLAALGIGIGLGSVAAGRLSASKVEYGILPLGAIGLTLTSLAFGLAGPGFAGTMALMALMGIASGLIFVPLNALIQWRSPDDRRGAVIAFGNMLINLGMLAGSVLAMGLSGAGFSARETFLGMSVALAIGTIWSLWLVPDAFLRFVLVMLGHTIYRLRVLGRENVPEEGPALLTPNHISFADGLFLISSIDRPIRFVVYAEYFKRRLIGRFLSAMGAIPVASSGGPRMILEAFREAGRALDNGELVCIFPEGQLTRTGMTLPFQRGLERIVKGRDVPIIPVHLDRVTSSIFSPIHRGKLPERIPLPITVSFGKPLPSSTSRGEIRRMIHELDQEAWEYRKADRLPLHQQFIRRARRHPFRLAVVDPLGPGRSYFATLTRTIALARALRTRWSGQENVGILLPTGVAGCITNLAAAVSGRAAVNLNFTGGRASITSAASQAALKTVVTSRAFLEKAKIELPEGVEPIWLEDVGPTIDGKDRLAAFVIACLAPRRTLERLCGAERIVGIDDIVALIFSSGSEGEPKGVRLTHFNIDSNVEAINQVFQPLPTDRILDVLPLFHSFGYMLLWLGTCRGMALICHVSPLETATVGALVEAHGATVLFATPTFLNLYRRRCAPGQFGSLRFVVAGAEKLPDNLLLSFEDTFGIRPLEGYGVTECSPVVAVNAPDYRTIGTFQPGTKRGTVGHPLPGVSIRIVDPESLVRDGVGEPLPIDTEGMVLVKGPNVMKGYLNRDDLTNAAIRDGWYVTGDLGMLDEDGFLKITGRLSRFSKIGGEMVPHGRVEEALHEAIGAEEAVFAVTAVPDGKGSDALAVLHTLTQPQVDEALAKFRKLGLPNLFLPRRDHFIKVESLPLLGTGKLDLRATRKIAEEALIAESAVAGS